MASLNNVAQRILGVRRDMIVPHKAGALSGVMVASAEPMKTMRILTMKKIGRSTVVTAFLAST
jgi:hypothetical protein